MEPIIARIPNDDHQTTARGADRHVLRLPTSAETAGEAIQDLLILNLSTTGFLFEAKADLKINNRVELTLPHIDRAVAEVVWSHNQIFGCRFVTPISKAGVSAALLQAPIPIKAGEMKPAEGGEGQTASVLTPEDSSTDKLPLWVRAWTVIGITSLLWGIIGLGAVVAFS